VNLPQRLLASSVAAALPVAAVVFFASEWLRTRAMSEALSHYLVTAQTAEAGPRCSSDPIGFGLHRPDARPDTRDDNQDLAGDLFELYAYDASFQPADPYSPKVPEGVRRTLVEAPEVTSTYATGDGTGVAVSVRTSWPDGPCAFLMARMRPIPGQTRDRNVVVALAAIAVAGVVWLSGGYLVRAARPARG
jgi:hypothetical protein